MEYLVSGNGNSEFLITSPGNQRIFSVFDYRCQVMASKFTAFHVFPIAVNFVSTISVKETLEALLID